MKPNNTKEPSGRSIANDLECPSCASRSIETSIHNDEFNYGSGDSAVVLRVDLPVRRCTECEIEFVDHEGEQLQHDAVCRHLGILTPAEVRNIREERGMTRAAFAEISGLGIATLGRWESGSGVQNRAYDCYLRLLSIPGNLERSRHFMASRTESYPETTVGENQFQRLIVDPGMLHQAEQFKLRPTGI